MRWRFIVVLLAVAAIAARQPAPSVDLAETIGGIVDDVLRQSPVAGASVAVGRGGEVVFARGFGIADRSTGRALEADAVMDIGSIGKQFTAAAVLKLVVDGRVELDQPIARYLPQWEDGGRATTVRQLLNHTSGLEDPPFSEVRPEPRFLQPIPSDGLLAFARTARFRFQPQESWFYANTGYVLLGLMLERLHGKPYGQVIEEAIARPLGLDSLSYCEKSRDIPRRVRDYVLREGKLEPIPAIDVSWFGGAGSLCASASDLVRWEYALAAGRVMPAALRETMDAPTTVRAAGVSTVVEYGFGRTSGVYGGHRKVGHTGAGAGISSILAHYPDDDLVLVVLLNTSGGGAPDARTVEARLAARLLGVAAAAQAADVPVTLAQAAAWSGTYAGSYGQRVEFSGCEGDGLCARLAGTPGPPRRLLHYGSGTFAGPVGPGSELRFVPAGRAEWVVHTMHGMHDDLLRRTAATAK